MISKSEFKKSFAGLIRKIFLGVCIIAFSVSVVFLVNTYVIQPHRTQQSNEILPKEEESNTNTTENKQTGETVQEKYLELLKINSEFVGRLNIDAISETGFNVVQCGDNQKYLSTGFYGEGTIYGSIFVDYRNNIKKFDKNTIIYGHNTTNGYQFGNLDKYSDLKVYKKYPTVEFNTIYSNYTWKIFAAFLINTKAEDDNGYIFPYLTTSFPSDENFEKFISNVKSRSFFINDAVEVTPNDKILTFSTCDHTFKDARFVVMARLVRSGETAEVDVSGARENENQRFPQIWYDKYADGNNPYRYSENYTLNEE